MKKNILNIRHFGSMLSAVNHAREITRNKDAKNITPGESKEFIRKIIIKNLTHENKDEYFRALKEELAKNGLMKKEDFDKLIEENIEIQELGMKINKMPINTLKSYEGILGIMQRKLEKRAAKNNKGK